MRRSLTLLLLSFVLAACGGDAEIETADAESSNGDLEVVDSAGITQTLDPDHPEPIDELAAALSDQDQRVDLGNFFERDEIAGIPGRRLALRGAVLDTWAFDSDAEARAFVGRFSPDGRQFDDEPLPWNETTHLWVRGRLVAMYVGNQGGTIAAMDQVARRTSQHVDDSTVSVEELESVVRQAAGDRLAIAPAALQLVSRERVTFANACLEVSEAAEVCHEVQTRGWRFVFMNGEERIVAHADVGGARVFFPGHGG